MRKLTADLILLPSGELAENQTLITNNGTVAGIDSNKHDDAEYYEGVLCPGFINAHCHLELSHLKNKIPAGTGLPGFIDDLVKVRKETGNPDPEELHIVNEQLWKSGISGAGDISNTDITFDIKASGNVRYHTFIELFNLNPAKAKETFSAGKQLLSGVHGDRQTASLTPHAPYSAPSELLDMIKSEHGNKNKLWSIHFRETPSEDEMFLKGSGKLISLFRDMGIEMSWFDPPEIHMAEWLSQFFPERSNLMFVHNTFADKDTFDYLKSTGVFNRSWFCVCPNANLYIEKSLPKVYTMRNAGCKIVTGTDSLASNNALNILEEIKTLHANFPKIPVSELLIWATRNGAEYFGWNDLGSFDKGKTPGVVCIKGLGRESIHENAIAERVI